MRASEWLDRFTHDQSPRCACGLREAQHDPETATTEDCEGFNAAED